ncbi:MAG: peptidoglycan DD-metalloendopeptidase family protein [Sphingobium sp.]|nr:peptidoglycan DD-metalloendopeptidase family protein [Sphingobium sp.]MBP6111342.1 peptidoglycan DD-metalloendopeptidase family protein [Sphingobium sp.]MBP8671324.1 peptidoglycan DD-metalloendopeptidase family protein [Sphingobium sp.]MBP9156660.1 peptidoglycan DD-metalloendopeptidase family protein [Sphingobium sp.]MCC6481763.1 peptidoglycan DD-metalloendopeptidase family protein [Sphingomonadaceae bacterium]
MRPGLVLMPLLGLGACVGAPPPVSHALPPSSVAAPPARPALVLQGAARQGGVVVGIAPSHARALTLDGAAVPVASDGRFLLAFDRDAGPNAVLTVELADGARIVRTMAVAPGNWRIEHVDASPTANIPSAEFQARRPAELARIAAARGMDNGSDGWRQSFIWPVQARISGLFGAQRVYRGTPGSYHSGVDIAAPARTPFIAPADGVVVLAAADAPFTLEGHLLIVDHGMGLSSAFLHCASLAVKEGDVVRQGQMLGTVGRSGRASGPHLHWGMKWRAARIDPLLLAGPMP